MLKLLMIVSVLSSLVIANDIVLKYETKRVKKALKRAKGIELKDVKLLLKKPLKKAGWYGYIFDLKLTAMGKSVHQRDILFSDGEVVTSELIDINSNVSFKNILYPTLGVEYYNTEHLIAGDKNASHKLVLFSDPLCPICLDEVADLIKSVKQNPRILSLYYYPMPLDMHPTAKTMVKAAMLLQMRGYKDVDYKLYKINQDNFNTSKPIYDQYEEKDNKKALEYFNTIFNTNLKLSDLDSQVLKEKVQADLDMAEKAFVQGTPTLFVDGEFDRTRSKYEKYIK